MDSTPIINLVWNNGSSSTFLVDTGNDLDGLARTSRLLPARHAEFQLRVSHRFVAWIALDSDTCPLRTLRDSCAR